MAVTTEVAKPNFFVRVIRYYHDAVAEMKKVTWPDKAQVRQMTIQILVFVLFIGAVIALLDLVLQGALIRLPQSLLR